ncbi:MAG: hypothetical protein WAP51_02610 [Candidatus Sungiibacteriota bacterium]
MEVRMLTHYLSLVLSLHPVLFALLMLGVLFAWFGLGYLGLRWWIATGQPVKTWLRYLTLMLGPVSLTVIFCVVVVITLYIIVVELLWQDMALTALNRFHAHIKNLG